MVKTKKILEIFYRERMLFYLCRSFDQLNHGQDYGEALPAILLCRLLKTLIYTKLPILFFNSARRNRSVSGAGIGKIIIRIFGIMSALLQRRMLRLRKMNG